MPDRGEIGRRVAEAAIALLHDERKRLPLFRLEAGREQTERAFADDGASARLELARERTEERVVEALAAFVLRAKADVELRVDVLEVAARDGDERAPELERRGVAALEEDDALSCALRERGITL